MSILTFNLTLPKRMRSAVRFSIGHLKKTIHEWDCSRDWGLECRSCILLLWITSTASIYPSIHPSVCLSVHCQRRLIWRSCSMSEQMNDRSECHQGRKKTSTFWHINQDISEGLEIQLSGFQWAQVSTLSLPLLSVCLLSHKTNFTDCWDGAWRMLFYLQSLGETGSASYAVQCTAPC